MRFLVRAFAILESAKKKQKWEDGGSSRNSRLLGAGTDFFFSWPEKQIGGAKPRRSPDQRFCGLRRAQDSYLVCVVTGSFLQLILQVYSREIMGGEIGRKFNTV